jgi:DNA ligase-1
MEALGSFADLVKRLQSTNGRLEKEGFLREVSNQREVLEILKFLFDPFVVSGISDKKLNKFKKFGQDLPLLSFTGEKENDKFSVTEVLNYFRKNNTGRDEDIKFLVKVAKKSGHEDLVYSVIKRDLKLGIQAATLNKVFGESFVPKFDVMLAESYADNCEFVKGKEFIITEKLDGVRCLLMFNDGVQTFFSRQGQAISGLVELTDQSKYLPKDFCYDGELLLENKGGLPSKDLYRATVKITSSDNEKSGLIFNLFDMAEKRAFLRGEDSTAASVRKKRLHELLLSVADKCPNIKEVPICYQGTDTCKIDEFLQEFTLKDGEGCMVSISDGTYQCKRTKNLLKVKQFNTADVEVLELEEGSGANRGKLGAVIVRFIGPNGEYYTCRVGSGFKLEERDFFWKNPDQIRGKIIEIGYFELSRNQNDENYSLRFPTFKYVRNDKTEISMY